MTYESFLESKSVSVKPSGFTPTLPLNPKLFDWQSDIVKWAIRRGKSALFEDCGLGKTPQQLEWGHHVVNATNLPVLIVAPLAVSQQTQREAAKFGYQVTLCRSQSQARDGINITNYEMLDHFEPDAFGGIVLDESSILKGDGPTRRMVTEFASGIQYRLACTATPAPNDYMELGNHAEFLGVMKPTDMLATFFCHDGGDTAKWRLKGHAERNFWRWVASWAVMLRKPSDLGYPNDGYELPPIEYHQHTVKAEWTSDHLFPVEAETLQERRAARRDSLASRVKLAADLANSSSEPWLIWCDLNDESKSLKKAIPNALEITGSGSAADKESAAVRFVNGDVRVLISKPSIFGFGLNFQHCRNMAFVGLSDSWEQVYQATRRCWRFGQTRPVNAHFITGELEGAVVRNIQRKEQQAFQMAAAMVEHMKEINSAEIHGATRQREDYKPANRMEVPSWIAA